MRALSAILYADLIGKPFEPGARGPHTYDCLGLAAEIQRRLGVALPTYMSEPAELHRQLAAGGALEDARRIEAPEPGCVVLLRSPDASGRHLGVMVDAHRMIHASEVSGSVVCEPLMRSFWGRRVLGFYRVRP